MIETIQGRIGGGKTYSCVCKIAAKIADGGTVYANIPIVKEKLFAYIQDRFGVVPEDDQLHLLPEDAIMEIWDRVPRGTQECPVLVVVDEADSVGLDARDTMKVPKAFRTYLKQSRKRDQDLVFITQHIKNLDSQIGRLNQYIWTARDMSRFTIPILGVPWPFDQILLSQVDYDGSFVHSQRYITKDPAIYQCYDSFALHGMDAALERIGKRNLKRVEGSSARKQISMLAGLNLAVWGAYLIL